MKLTNFLDRFLYRDIITHLIPGSLASASLLLFDEPRKFLLASPQESFTAISTPLITLIAFSTFYAVGFITWLLPFAIQSRLGWTKVKKSDGDLISDLILKQLESIYGTDRFKDHPGWTTWLSSKIAEISVPETFHSSVERNTMLWNLQLTLSGSFGAWSIALFVAAILSGDLATRGMYGGAAILGTILVCWLFRYTREMYDDIRSSKGLLFLALRGVSSEKLTELTAT